MPHTADLRIEVWSPSREGCIGEAVLNTVESFLNTSLARAQHIRQCGLTGDHDDGPLLEEVIYVLDTAGEAPVDVELEGISRGSVPHVRHAIRPSAHPGSPCF